MNASPAPKVALLYPGSRAARGRADPAASRFEALFEAFAASVDAQLAVWCDDFANEVRDPTAHGAARSGVVQTDRGGTPPHRLDDLRREVAQEGVIVSAHTDAIQCLGTKDVLFETRDLPFGSDVHRIDSLA